MLSQKTLSPKKFQIQFLYFIVLANCYVETGLLLVQKKNSFKFSLINRTLFKGGDVEL